MTLLRTGLPLLTLVLIASLLLAEEKAKTRSPREALKDFNNLIGTWKGTGAPEGTREEKRRGFWVETIAWAWQFKGDDAWLQINFDKSKHFTKGELRYLPETNRVRLTVVTTDKRSLTFEGPHSAKRLVLQREDPDTKEAQRLAFSFLHHNRYLYQYEVKEPGKASFKRVYRVGATKEGTDFAGPGDSSPECVVSGGKGTIAVMYKGKTYYVCCTGCRDEFKHDPEKYIKEYEQRKAKK